MTKITHQDRPIIGYVRIPLRLNHFEDNTNHENDFQCGFANWKLQDSIANVGENGELGSLGGSMGGFYEMNRYFPQKENGKYEKWMNVQMNTEDIWYAIDELLQKVISSPEEFAKLKEEMQKYHQKREKLAQIQKMQKEAEEEEKLLAEIAAIENQLSEEDITNLENS